VLLNHEWIRCDKKGLPSIEQEPQYDPRMESQTVLIPHGAFGCLLDARAMAQRLVGNASERGDRRWQCLLVDLRGHGESDLDDYTEVMTHIVTMNAAEIALIEGIAT
jgi:pimeloyl-ACP methyl ester carboxylesterase